MVASGRQRISSALAARSANTGISARARVISCADVGVMVSGFNVASMPALHP
jgi:hypothetical protein